MPDITAILRGIIGKYDLTDDEWQAIETAIKVINYGGWIKTEERVPIDSGEVVTFESSLAGPDFGMAIIGSYEDGEWTNRYGVTLERVTHWIPKPEAYDD